MPPATGSPNPFRTAVGSATARATISCTRLWLSPAAGGQAVGDEAIEVEHADQFAAWGSQRTASSSTWPI